LARQQRSFGDSENQGQEFLGHLSIRGRSWFREITEQFAASTEVTRFDEKI
jgi:hypothetical protein